MSKSFNGNYIYEYRNKNNLTQDKFSQKFNAFLKEKGIDAEYNNKSISAWESGNREPQSLEIVKALAEFLGVGIEELSNCAETVTIETAEITEKPKRVHRDPNDTYYSDELTEFVFGNIRHTADNRIASSFWMLVPVDIDLSENGVSDPGVLELWYESVYNIKYDIKDAQIVNKYAFREYLCDFIVSNKYMLDNSWRLERYLYDRFDGEALCDIYSTFLSNDFSTFAEEHGLHDTIRVDCVPIEEIYTSKGLLIQVESTAEMSQEVFDLMHREWCEKIGLAKASDVEEKNKMAVADWL